MALQGQQDEEERPLPPEVIVAMVCTDLIAYPERWINRRVETVELLSYEETRRRVSVDFTLSAETQKSLELTDGVAVPITVLTKEARRNFDLRDEGGHSVAVLGKSQNGNLAHVALMNAALDALPQTPAQGEFEVLAADLRRVVFESPAAATEAVNYLVGEAEAGDELRTLIWADETCRRLLTVLRENYVLFAVVPPGGPTRRVLKYGYGYDLPRERLRDRRMLANIVSPDRRRFSIGTPSVARGVSFHLEVAIPEELRVTTAFLYDVNTREAVSQVDCNVSRASLYARDPIKEGDEIDAFVEVAPERGGRTMQSAATAMVVAALIWLGIESGLDAENPSAAVSLLLAGAAIFSGVTAAQGKHQIVRDVFWRPRFWLAVVSLSALAASASLAMELPSEHPVGVWRWAAIASTLAAVRLGWSAIRAPA